MIDVNLNGLRLIPGIDYTASPTQISFLEAPCVGDHIVVSSAIPGAPGGAFVQTLTGTGHTFLYKLDSSFNSGVELQHLLADAWEYHRVPSVEDVLNQLRVVVELVKQHDPLHQRR